MAGGDKPIFLFFTLLIIFFCLNLLVPVLNNFFGVTKPMNNQPIDEYFWSSEGGNGSTDTIDFIIQLLTVPFWTIGLPDLFNYILIIPRIAMLVMLYYIAFPTK